MNWKVADPRRDKAQRLLGVLVYGLLREALLPFHISTEDISNPSAVWTPRSSTAWWLGSRLVSELCFELLHCGICLVVPVDGDTRQASSLQWLSTASYLVPFFFEKVLLTLRWRLLSSKAANPPLSRVTVSSMLDMPLPKASRESQQSLSHESAAVTQGWASQHPELLCCCHT